MDNATNNDKFIENLEELLKQRDIVYDSSQHRIICFPHVVHICVTHIIKQFAKSSQRGPDCVDDGEMDELVDLGEVLEVAERIEEHSDSDEEDLADVPEGPPWNESQQTYEQALDRKPLDLVRRIVRAIHASNQRWEFLKQLILDGNKSGRFKDASGNAMKILVHKLPLDVKTRWDSTYLMINRVLQARPVRVISLFHIVHVSRNRNLKAIDVYLSSPENKDLAKLRLTQQEWAVIEDLVKILEVCIVCVTFMICLIFVEIPHDVQMIMASEKLPSLCGMIPAIEIFMTSWENLGDKQPRLKHFIKPGLKFAVKYYRAINKTSSYIIAMCKSYFYLP